ncbi:spermatogenesis-associated protein 48 [Hemicordylus capensis]|uniref:spermatogenesis-associated protein 48 n=1 Tax=Hemicordylus capensis TaxID=884348 RepID=UPI002302C4A9|nr:spermatogenesis-associated protein 48 [Hemicordylus capensis]XP_053117339.1 spermatogenesis-associated protein 48 [Hemicordylus capensis]XP_053117340.1 spermatogenesis-associated protein 48 [Hemicordylus capensis]XP_053117341.1 spermatogenesis-associated protein 48 [Hemicordylus capensis]XP_053117343.1 spermatogenesis-associated protein 48 [Hemicordylus capensis]
MASQVTARQFIPFKYLNPPTDSLHKMHRKQHKDLLKKMYMPFVRGPDDRHYFGSFQDKHSDAFLKSNPYAPPEDKNYPFAPHRDDVPVLNPWTGLLSSRAKAETDQQIRYSKTAGYSMQHPLRARVPHEKAQTSYRRPSLILEERKQDHRWNSRAVSDVCHRAQIGGWTSPVKVIPSPPQVKECFSPHTFVFNVDSDVKSSDSSKACRDEKARKYMYTSVTQNAYEDIPWDRMLPPKPQPPDSTLEPMADCVSQGCTIKQYESVPEISQVVGGLWDRFQRRYFISPHKPITFVSPYSRTQHVPLYTGRVGADNVEDLDNPYVDLITHGNVRIAKPRYVESSYHPNTFGYTGKVHWSATQPVNSNLPPTSPSIIAGMHGYMAKHGQPSEFPHCGPLSRIVTPTEPQNSFNRKEKERIKI